MLRRRRDALAEAREAANRAQTSSSATVLDALANYLDERRSRVVESSWVSYEGHCRLLDSLYGVPLRDLTADKVENCIKGLVGDERGPATANKVLMDLRSALDRAVKHRLIPYNVARDVDYLGTVDKKAKAFTDDEVRVIRAYRAASGNAQEWADIIDVLFGTGVRLGEALGLRGRDVQVRSHLLRVEGGIRRIDKRFREPNEFSLRRVDPKTDAGHRLLSPADFAWKVLVRRASEVRPDDLLFHTASGRPHSARNFNRVWDSMLKRLEGQVQDLPPHSARHTVASQMLATGGTLDDVKRYLGHSKITHTSDLYGHFVVGRTKVLGKMLSRALG